MINKNKKLDLITILTVVFVMLMSVNVFGVKVIQPILPDAVDICNHTYGTTYTKNSEGHTRNCTKCGEAETEDHTWSNYKSVGVAHTMECSVCGYSSSAQHSGGTATCNTKGKCEFCDAAYLAATGNHTGGTATCTKKKICTVCGTSYGSTAEHQVGTDTSYYTIENTFSHGQICQWCEEIIVNVVSCSFDEYEYDEK